MADHVPGWNGAVCFISAAANTMRVVRHLSKTRRLMYNIFCSRLRGQRSTIWSLIRPDWATTGPNLLLARIRRSQPMHSDGSDSTGAARCQIICGRRSGRRLTYSLCTSEPCGATRSPCQLACAVSLGPSGCTGLWRIPRRTDWRIPWLDCRLQRSRRLRRDIRMAEHVGLAKRAPSSRRSPPDSRAATDGEFSAPPGAYDRMEHGPLRRLYLSRHRAERSRLFSCTSRARHHVLRMRGNCRDAGRRAASRPPWCQIRSRDKPRWAFRLFSAAAAGAPVRYACRSDLGCELCGRAVLLPGPASTTCQRFSDPT